MPHNSKGQRVATNKKTKKMRKKPTKTTKAKKRSGY